MFYLCQIFTLATTSYSLDTGQVGSLSMLGYNSGGNGWQNDDNIIFSFETNDNAIPTDYVPSIENSQ